MKPYYQDERAGITIYHNRCEEVMAHLPEKSIDLILTDPPYFRVKDEPWDRQWDTAAGFLAWIDALCKEWQRILKPNGSLYVFASPDMSTRVEMKIREYFNVLNNIRWIKEEGWHKKADKDALRSYLSPWEAIIFAEQRDDQYADAEKALHKEVYAPLGRYIQSERERAGFTRNQVEVALGFVSSSDPTRGTALCYRWEEGACLPTKEVYERLRCVLNSGGVNEYLRQDYEELRQDYEELRQDYEELRQDYEELRRPFAVSKDTSDIWHFATVQAYYKKHPCEKPLALIEHIIRTSTRTNALILDCCMGSGKTLRAAKNLGRTAIGIDISEQWCESAACSLMQEVLFLEEAV